MTEQLDEGVEIFYSNIEALMRTTKRHEITMIMGDLNVKIGASHDGNVVTKYGLGS